MEGSCSPRYYGATVSRSFTTYRSGWHQITYVFYLCSSAFICGKNVFVCVSIHGRTQKLT